MDDEILETPETAEEGFTSLDPEPAPAPEPKAVPAPEPVSAPAPEPEPIPEPESPAAPVEVITVEDLLDRLTGESREDEEAKDGETEDTPQEAEAGGETEAGEGSSGGSGSIGGDTGTAGVFPQMDKLLESAETVQGTLVHPMMETPFEDYTVTEGLLLLVFVILLLDFFLNLLRRWF